MKELSIEEKAKRYDEVVNEIKNLRDMLLEEGVIKKDGVLCDNFNRIFPELKESEDENIRKALIHFFSNTENTSFEYWEGIPKSKVISWLEKQAEHANFRNKIQIGDKVTRNEDGVLVNLSQLKRVAKKDEKQGEQKYTHRDIDDAYLKGIADVKREVKKIDEQTEKMKKEIAEFIFNSKEDIKQRYEWIKCLGFDVEFSNEEKQAEQKPTFEMKTPEESLGIDSDTYNKLVDECIYGEQKPIDPDTLIQQRVDALADIVAEQKSANKVEPIFNVGDKIQYLKVCGTIMTIEKIENGEYIFANNMGHATIKDGNKWYLVEQKPAWSEEDEKHLKLAIDNFQTLGNSFLTSWLKSLKDRVQPQPKQEWKQENTGDLTDFENAMMHIGDSFFGENAGLDPNDTNAIKEQANFLLELIPKEWSEEDGDIRDNIIRGLKRLSGDMVSPNQTYQKEIQWLKSLRPHWKPSDEQMENLSRAFNGGTFRTSLLMDLYQDLKKTKRLKL